MSRWYHWTVVFKDDERAVPCDPCTLCFAENKVLDLAEMWFQEDGATWQTARVTITQLRGELDEGSNTRLGWVIWRT